MLVTFRSLVCLAILQLSFQTAASSIDGAFVVKYGDAGAGGCDNGQVQQWWDDSATLINLAAQGASATDMQNSEFLFSFFKILPGQDHSNVLGKISAVQDVINGGLPAGEKPWLFCGSGWLAQQSWDDIAYERVIGQPNAAGRTIAQTFRYSPSFRAQYVPFWSSDLKQYIFDESGDLCTGGTLGFATDAIQPGVITLCTSNFNGPQFLSDVPAVTQEGVSLSRLEPQSLTLFHELFHLCVGCQFTPDSGYSLLKVVQLGTSDAVGNPESYTDYALALWLGQQNPQYTWRLTRSELANAAPEDPPSPPKIRRTTKAWLEHYRPPTKRSNSSRSWIA